MNYISSFVEKDIIHNYQDDLMKLHIPHIFNTMLSK